MTADSTPRTRRTQNHERPFYGEYAWAYNLLIDRPVEQECDAISSWLTARGVRTGELILDAGCGTGLYSMALARRGYVLEGVDASAEMIDQAHHALGEQRLVISLSVGSLFSVPGVTELDSNTRRLLISESHVLDDDGRPHRADYNFVMQCWTEAEVERVRSTRENWSNGPAGGRRPGAGHALRAL